MATREIVQLRDKETGDINELRDKALKEAAKSSTPSDATNNSVIPLETENGETIKIKAESLMKAFATMINSNSKSTITTLFGALTANNNTEFGAINMSNLASVLGGFCGYRGHIPSSNINAQSTVDVVGLYSVSGTTHQSTAFYDDGFLIVANAARAKFACNGKIGMYGPNGWRDI